MMRRSIIKRVVGRSVKRDCRAMDGMRRTVRVVAMICDDVFGSWDGRDDVVVARLFHHSCCHGASVIVVVSLYCICIH